VIWKPHDNMKTKIEPRYRLRTLMIVLALGPPVLALSWVYFRPALITGAIGLLAVAGGMVISVSIDSIVARHEKRLRDDKYPHVPFHDPLCAKPPCEPRSQFS